MKSTANGMAKEISELYFSLIAAWNAADATQFAVLFTLAGGLPAIKTRLPPIMADQRISRR